MPQFTAVMWKVKPGFDEELAELFANSRRPESFVVKDAAGAEVGRLLATAVLLKDDTIVRVTQYEGDLPAVMRHIAAHKGMRELEDALGKYVVEQRATDTPEAFREFFERTSMRVLLQRFADDR